MVSAMRILKECAAKYAFRRSRKCGKIFDEVGSVRSIIAFRFLDVDAQGAP